MLFKMEENQGMLFVFPDEEPPRDIASAHKKANDLLEQQMLEDSLNKAQELWDAVERFVNSKIADMFSNAQSLVLMAERMGVGTEGERQMLKQARNHLERGEFTECVSQLKDCTEMVSTALHNLFQSRVEAFNVTADRADELNLDFSKVEDTLAKAKASSEKGDFEHAFGTLNIAESEANAIVSGFDTIGRAEGAHTSAEGHWRGGCPDIGNSAQFRSEDRRSQDAGARRRGYPPEEIEQRYPTPEGRLLIANKIGSDISEVLSDLDAARSTLARGDFKTAAALVSRAEIVLEKGLEGYWRWRPSWHAPGT
jgi:hypothetical protein